MKGIKLLSDLKKNKEFKTIEQEFYFNNDKLNVLTKRDKDLSKKKFKMKINASTKNISFIKKKQEDIEIDSDLIKLWDRLSVSNVFKNEFKSKLKYFSREYQEILIESEKKKMNKIFDLISRITIESISREKVILILKTFQDMNYTYYNDLKNYNEAKKYLKNLRNHTINFYLLINELRNLISFDIIQGKFDIDKNYYFKNIHPENYFKRNNEFKFIYECILGKIFKIKNVFDILFMDFDNEKIDKRKFYDVYQTFISELIYYNFNSIKKINRIYIRNHDKSIDSKFNHNYSSSKFNPLEHNEKVNFDITKKKRKDSITCKEFSELNNESKCNNYQKDTEEEFNVPEVDDNYINEDDINKYHFEFFTEDISKLEDIYNNYFFNISKEQVNTFNVKENLCEYSKGIKTMFIIKKNYNNDINLFTSLNYIKDDNNTLHISNFSTSKNNYQEIKKGMEELINFLSKNQINYQYLTIDLYYEDINGKMILNNNINNIFKELKFKWSKLENLEGGIRFQKMKYTNPIFIESNSNDNSLIKITSGSIIYCGSDKMENIINSKDFILNLNLFNINILEKVYENNIKDIENIKFNLNSLYYNESNDLTEINNILLSENINIKLPSLKKGNTILYDLFTINIQFDSFIPVKINEKKYIRIDSEIQVLFEKETQQKLYMIFINDSNLLIIAEPNIKFNQILKKEGNNIYNIFKEIYHNIEELNEKISAIYIRELNEEKLYFGNNTFEKTQINNIHQIYNFYKLTSNKDNNNFSIKILPRENDIIIKENFFISIMNSEIANDYNISSLFCTVLK